MEGILGNIPWAALGRLPGIADFQTNELNQLRKRMESIEQMVAGALPTTPSVSVKQEGFASKSLGIPASFNTPPLHQAQGHEQMYDHRHSNISVTPLIQPLNPDQSPQPEDRVLAPNDDASEDDELNEPRENRPPAIPVNHTTGAALLLQNFAVAELVKDIIGHRHIIKNEHYPMTHEERRGLLRPFGRGEGIDSAPGYEKDSIPDHWSESTPGDTHSDTSSPAQESDWPSWVPGPTPHHHEPTSGDINSDAKPDFLQSHFSRETVHSLVESYKSNINNMHPILTSAALDQIVEDFLKRLPGTQAKPRAAYNTVGFAVPARNPESPGNKRKRSPSRDQQESSSAFDPRQIPRTLASCLVLFVLALGKICQHKGKIPDVGYLLSPESDNFNSPIVRNGHPASPMQNSPSLSTLPSPIDAYSRVRRTSLEGGPPRVDRRALRNMDLIPGLNYFAHAAEILGTQSAGISLLHVHVQLLAGLYQGQLGRVLESHSYIYGASCTLLYMLRR